MKAGGEIRYSCLVPVTMWPMWEYDTYSYISKSKNFTVDLSLLSLTLRLNNHTEKTIVTIMGYIYSLFHETTESSLVLSQLLSS